MHRGGAILLGLGLWVFGILGLVHRLDFFSTNGVPVLGLSTNGLLAAVSLVVGALLIGAAVRGGRTASTVTVVIGALFVLSGVLNVLVLGTAYNLLAFRMPNVVFSLIAGALLLVLGGYGRFAGHLPTDNPYYRARHADDPLPTGQAVLHDPDDIAAARELADVERAVAQGGGTPEQVRRLAGLGQLRRPEDRLQAWRAGRRPV
ncbi:DUF4383 domain-containing protein [Pseudonocardia acidicola]|uniref:DUF4383 domain-containing protein n=1 Tax=Pseudonocardia acidicola TaxID=2724939 RepID=UPI0030846701